MKNKENTKTSVNWSNQNREFSQSYENMYNSQQFYPQQFGQPQMQQVPRKTEIIHVNGQNGAQAFQMMPNSQALLLDDTAPIVWLAQTDGAGYKTVTPYTIAPYQPEPEIDLKDIDARLRRIEEVMNNANTKSNVTGSKKQSGKQQPQSD